MAEKAGPLGLDDTRKEKIILPFTLYQSGMTDQYHGDILPSVEKFDYFV